MSEGQKILLSSLGIFTIIALTFLGYGFFIYPNLDEPQEDVAILSDSENPDVLAVVDQSNPYAYVCPETFEVLEVPNDFPTIQSAIDSVEGGVIVIVAPGIYNESIVLKPEICLIAQEFGRSEIQGLGEVVIETSSQTQVKNFKISSLGRSEVGISIVDAQGVNVEVNTFENLKNAILSRGDSQFSVISNAFRDIDVGIFVENGDFFIEQNNIQAVSTGIRIVSSKGDLIGLVLEGGEYGVDADDSELFFNKNIFKGQSLAALLLSPEGDYEIGDNFFDNVNEEILRQ